MSPTTMSKFGLLSFAATALAAPWSLPSGYRGHHHSHLHSRPHGTGTGYPTGTGAPFPAGNGTGPYGSGTGTAASTGFAYSTGYVTVTEVITEGASSVEAAGVSTSSSCSTPTVSTTTTQVLTLTVSPAPANQLPSGYSASSNAWWSVPSVSTPSVYPQASSTPAAAVTTSSSVELSSSVAPSPPAYSSQSVNAAGFSYGGHSFPWGHHSSAKASSESSPAAVPTPTTTYSTPAAPVETSTTPATSAAPTSYSIPAVVPSSVSVPAIVPTSASIPAVVPTSVSIPAIVIPSSSAAPVETSSSSTPAAAKPSSSYGGSTTGTKRGLPYNDASLTDCFAGSKVSWAYNWGSSSDGLDTDKFEYVPQLWSDRSDFLSGWTSNAKAAISSGSKYILGFNEPDLPAQANMLPAVAATAYKTYITDEFGSSGVTLGSPAVTNGGGDMGLTWLGTFLDACADCNIGFVAVHWYDSYANTDYFKQHVTQAHEQTGLPVWVTEFGTTDGSDDQIAGFLQEVMPWMDGQDFVERYAYFMASDGKLNSGSEMSTYGKTYATYESA